MSTPESEMQLQPSTLYDGDADNKPGTNYHAQVEAADVRLRAAFPGEDLTSGARLNDYLILRPDEEDSVAAWRIQDQARRRHEASAAIAAEAGTVADTSQDAPKATPRKRKRASDDNGDGNQPITPVGLAGSRTRRHTQNYSNAVSTPPTDAGVARRLVVTLNIANGRLDQLQRTGNIVESDVNSTMAASFLSKLDSPEVTEDDELTSNPDGHENDSGNNGVIDDAAASSNSRAPSRRKQNAPKQAASAVPKGIKNITIYGDDKTDDDIFAGDFDNVRYGNLVRLMKNYAGATIAKKINEAHEEDIVKPQDIADRKRAAYNEVARLSKRTIMEVDKEVGDARRAKNIPHIHLKKDDK